MDSETTDLTFGNVIRKIRLVSGKHIEWLPRIFNFDYKTTFIVDATADFYIATPVPVSIIDNIGRLRRQFLCRGGRRVFAA